MGTLRSTFPELADEIARSREAGPRPGLTDDVESARITDVTYDNRADAGYIHVESTRTLSTVDQNVVGVRRRTTVPVESGYGINLDFDDHDRLRGVEVISPPARLKARLRDPTN